MKRFSAPVGFRFPCADPICRLSFGVTPVSRHPEERYICFACDFNFCAVCIYSYYRDPSDPATRATIPAIPAQILPEAGGKNEDLPPSYENVGITFNWGIDALPPSYEECKKIMVTDMA